MAWLLLAFVSGSSLAEAQCHVAWLLALAADGHQAMNAAKVALTATLIAKFGKKLRRNTRMRKAILSEEKS